MSTNTDVVPTIRDSIAKEIHYPACWDTAAYPTLEDAMLEMVCSTRFVCGECETRSDACKGTNCGCTDGASHSAECIAQHDAAVAGAAHAEIDRLNAIINTPESDEFLKGVAIEAEYQRQLHGVDATEARFDWTQYFWVTGYLLNKALAACKSGEGNGEKAKHHLVTTAALLSNWHNVLTGKPAACVHSNSGKPIADLFAASAPVAGDQPK